MKGAQSDMYLLIVRETLTYSSLLTICPIGISKTLKMYGNKKHEIERLLFFFLERNVLQWPV